MIMKNKKYIALSVAIALGLSACGDKTSQEYMQAGETSLAQAKIGDAIVQFKNAVRVEPTNPEARKLLATAYLKHGDYISAEKEFNKALELGSNDESIIVQLAIARAKLEDIVGIDTLIGNYGNISDNDYQGLLYFAGVANLNAQNVSVGEDYLGQAATINESGFYIMLI